MKRKGIEHHLPTTTKQEYLDDDRGIDPKRLHLDEGDDLELVSTPEVIFDCSLAQLNMEAGQFLATNNNKKIPIASCKGFAKEAVSSDTDRVSNHRNHPHLWRELPGTGSDSSSVTDFRPNSPPNNSAQLTLGHLSQPSPTMTSHSRPFQPDRVSSDSTHSARQSHNLFQDELSSNGRPAGSDPRAPGQLEGRQIGLNSGRSQWQARYSSLERSGNYENGFTGVLADYAGWSTRLVLPCSLQSHADNMIPSHVLGRSLPLSLYTASQLGSSTPSWFPDSSPFSGAVTGIPSGSWLSEPRAAIHPSSQSSHSHPKLIPIRPKPVSMVEFLRMASRSSLNESLASSQDYRNIIEWMHRCADDAAPTMKFHQERSSSTTPTSSSSWE